MYERYFGFHRRPFALTPDPSLLYPSRQHAMAMTLLEYGLESQAPFGLLTGAVGSGKTTLVRHLLRARHDGLAVGLITHTHAALRSLHPWILSALAIVPADDSDVAIYEALVDSFVRQYAAGGRTLLVVDEAQNLGVERLEELRLLSNVNSEGDIALQILLVGQPELRETLARPELVQLAQRISVDFHLRPLEAAETTSYVRHRLVESGGSAEVFEPRALEIVHGCSGGVPRLINQLCDTALVYAFAAQQPRVDEAVLAQVLRDRDAASALPVFPGAARAAAVAP